MVGYAGLFALAWWWSAHQAPGNPDALWHPNGRGLGDGMATVSGVLVGVACAGLIHLAVARWIWARRLDDRLAEIIGPLSWFDVLAITLASSLAEEALFRSAMQSCLGLAITSLVFGLLHSGPDKVFRPWTAMAIGMGFILGGLMWWSDNLWTPVACHATINFFGLRRIQRKPVHAIRSVSSPSA